MFIGHHVYSWTDGLKLYLHEIEQFSFSCTPHAHWRTLSSPLQSHNRCFVSGIILCSSVVSLFERFSLTSSTEAFIQDWPNINPSPSQTLQVKHCRLFSLAIFKCFYSSCHSILSYVRKQILHASSSCNCVLMEAEGSCSRVSCDYCTMSRNGRGRCFHCLVSSVFRNRTLFDDLWCSVQPSASDTTLVTASLPMWSSVGVKSFL